MTASPQRPRRVAVAFVPLIAALLAACTLSDRAPATPETAADCLSPTGEIVACPMAGPSPTMSYGATAPTPSPTGTSVLGVAGEAVLVTVARPRGDLTFTVIGLDGSSRVVGTVPNPLASRPKVSGAEGFVRDVVVGEAGFVVIPAIYGEEITWLTVSELKTGSTITTSDGGWYAAGPGDRLAIGMTSMVHPLSEIVTYALADPSAAPGLIQVPRDVRPLAWLAGDELGVVGWRQTGEDADGEPLVEVGVLDANGFRPGEADVYFRTGLERPTATGSSRLEIGANDHLDPSGTKRWRLTEESGQFVLARLDGSQEPIVVARLSPMPGEEEFWLRIVGIAPEGSRIALGDGSVWPTALTRLVDTRTGEVTIHPGAFAGWADTP